MTDTPLPTPEAQTSLPPPQPGTQHTPAAYTEDQSAYISSKPDKKPWKDRIPELVATIGAALVILALIGFITSTWAELSELQKAITLGGVAIGLTVAAAFLEKTERSISKVSSTVYMAATATVAATITLFGFDIGGVEVARGAITAGGLAAAAYAGWVLLRDRDSVLRLLTLTTALLYAAGPSGTALTDRFTRMDILDVFRPIAGFIDPSITSNNYLIMGAGWFLTGTVLLLFVSSSYTGMARNAATTYATFILFTSAAMVNLSENALGAFVALCIVLGYLIYGMVSSRQGIVIVGSVGAFFVGIRVLAALFSGTIAVTFASLAVGILMLLWAINASKKQNSETDDGDDAETFDVETSTAHVEGQ